MRKKNKTKLYTYILTKKKKNNNEIKFKKSNTCNQNYKRCIIKKKSLSK